MRVAQAQHPVMQVLGIGGERGLAGSQPAHHGQPQVQQRQEHHRDGQDDRHEGREGPLLSDECGIDLAGDTDRRGRQQQTDEHRARIAHEDAGGVEVVRQESDAGADEDRGDQGGEVGIRVG